MRTLRQKIKRYRDSMFRGSRADVFAIFGNRAAEREAAALEEEERQLAGDIEALERKPTTRQLFGWLSARSPASLRLVTIHENPRVTADKSTDPSNLPYLHRNPAV